MTTKDSKIEVSSEDAPKSSLIANEMHEYVKPSMDERRERRKRRNLEGKHALPQYQHKDGKFMYWAVCGSNNNVDRYHDLTDNDSYDPVTYADVGISHRNGRYVGNDQVEISIDGDRKQVLLAKPMEHRLEDLADQALRSDKNLHDHLHADAIKRSDVMAEIDPVTKTPIARKADHITEGRTVTNFPTQK